MNVDSRLIGGMLLLCAQLKPFSQIKNVNWKEVYVVILFVMNEALKPLCVVTSIARSRCPIFCLRSIQHMSGFSKHFIFTNDHISSNTHQMCTLWNVMFLKACKNWCKVINFFFHGCCILNSFMDEWIIIIILNL